MRTLLATLLLGLSACASSGTGIRYDAERGQTYYESRAISLGDPVGASGLGSARITLQAEAQCEGQACAPRRYDVSLSKSGGSSAAADYSSISFETDQGTVSFGGQNAPGSSAQFFDAQQGEFARLSVPAEIFRSFATASTLTIRLGGNTYQIGHARRAGLRSLLPEGQR